MTSQVAKKQNQRRVYLTWAVASRSGRSAVTQSTNPDDRNDRNGGERDLVCNSAESPHVGLVVSRPVTLAILLNSLKTNPSITVEQVAMQELFREGQQYGLEKWNDFMMFINMN